MSRLLVHGFSISIDGFGAGPNQDLENPLGLGELKVFDSCWSSLPGALFWELRDGKLWGLKLPRQSSGLASRCQFVLADVAIHWKEIRSALTVPVKSVVASNVAKPSPPKNAVGPT